MERKKEKVMSKLESVRLHRAVDKVLTGLIVSRRRGTAGSVERRRELQACDHGQLRSSRMVLGDNTRTKLPGY
jgi:hypothetical protein